MTEDDKLLKLIKKSGYTHNEIKEFMNNLKKVSSKQAKIEIGKNRIRMGVFGDPHFGNIETDYSLLKFYSSETKAKKVDFHICTGDIFDGWYQNRPSSIFEQNAVGFDNQMKLAVNKLKILSAPFYFITGNHSYNTFVRGAGVEAGPYLESKLEKEGLESYYLGNGEGDINIHKSNIKLLHPDGGTAYALSYRPQKIIESLESGQKPNLLFIGHFHKMEQLFYRNVHCFQTGTMMGKTKFMKGKGIPAHKGFWIIDAYINDSGQVDKIVPVMYPHYK